jgi:hypothetical protein
MLLVGGKRNELVVIGQDETESSTIGPSNKPVLTGFPSSWWFPTTSNETRRNEIINQ